MQPDPCSPDQAPLWTPQYPRWGVVRAVVIAGEWAVRFDDLNGDGREIELDVFRNSGAWGLWTYQDDVHLPSAGADPISGGAVPIAWAVGRYEPHTHLEIDWDDTRHTVTSDSEGWWLVVLDEDEGSVINDPWRSPRVTTAG